MARLMPAMPELVTVDPGKHWVGWAIFDDSQLTACRLDKATDVAGAFRKMRTDTLVVEVPQVYPVRKWRGDPNDLISVAVVAGMVIGALRASEVELIKPREWKGSRPKTVDNALTLSLLSEKERAIVDRVDVPAELRHNVTDAVGIGLWRLGRR